MSKTQVIFSPKSKYMKKTFYFLFLIILLTSCGHEEREIEDLKSEIRELKTVIEAQSNDKLSMQMRISELEYQLTNSQNGTSVGSVDLNEQSILHSEIPDPPPVQSPHAQAVINRLDLSLPSTKKVRYSNQAAIDLLDSFANAKPDANSIMKYPVNVRNR
jgi:hypothetical protein